MLAPWKNSCGKPRQYLKKQRHHFADKAPYSQSYGFSSGHVWMWELDHKEGWALKNWCFWTVLLEENLENLLDSKEIKAAHPKGNQPWILIGRTDAEAPILWPPDAKSRLIRIDPYAGKDWGQEEKGRHRVRWLDGITDSMDMSFWKLREVSDGQRRLVCCSSRGRKQLDATCTTNKVCIYMYMWFSMCGPCINIVNILGTYTLKILRPHPGLLNEKLGGGTQPSDSDTHSSLGDTRMF